MYSQTAIYVHMYNAYHVCICISILCVCLNCIYLRIYMCVCARAHVCVCVHACVRACMCACVHGV